MEQESLPAVSNNVSLINVIAEAAVNKDMDVAKLEKLMDLQERMLAREAREAYAVAYVKMKPELPLVIRTKHNTQTKSNYAALEDVNTVIDPILSRHGFATSFKVVSQTDTSVTGAAELWHSSGHVESLTMTMAIDNKGIQGTVNKTNPHAVASTITYLKRVATCAILNISTGDDRDGNATIGDDEAAELKNMLKDTKSDTAAFLKYMGVQSVEEIPAAKYLKAKNAIKAKQKGASDAGAQRRTG